MYFTTAKAGHRRIPTKVYKEWTQEACVKITNEYRRNGGRIHEKVPYRLMISARVDRRRDIDNIVKPTLDVLVKAGAVPDDRWCDYIRIERYLMPTGSVDRVPKKSILVGVWPVPAE